MHQTEQIAREICALDLRTRGVPDKSLAVLVDRFWPVLANEIRQGIVVDIWPFNADEIERLTREYRELLGER
ncbi:MAG: hypothetical protein DI549_03675 [Ancylobacter novellus]|uniref:Uncharacterized protein n=1 Tax=Ancylobacter novellus TaxID=921 RepID=A0A2W5R7B9_ANCNO|nr:MAG: hypothetical protein DI549_03675 [Ancylobacter novellus]